MLKTITGRVAAVTTCCVTKPGECCNTGVDGCKAQASNTHITMFAEVLLIFKKKSEMLKDIEERTGKLCPCSE